MIDHDAPQGVVTEDGVDLLPGDRAYDYYSRKAGHIDEAGPDAQGWFDFNHDGGTRAYLDGSRICSIQYAIRKGWVNA